MGVKHLSTGAVFGVAVLWASDALAGMPSPVLSDWAEVRIEAMSFAVVALLLSTAVIRWLWNSLAKDFAAMPRLGYGRTLAMVLLLGLVLVVVLTMIAGARELLTPGAWQKQGRLYKVAPPAVEPPKPPEARQAADRRENLLKLKAALWTYAAEHDGRFPKNTSEIETGLWELPGVAGMQYFYVPGLRLKSDAAPRALAYEPDVYDDRRMALLSDGEIVAMATADLRRLLPERSR